uniref:Nuclear Testis protein N-terminal domain-containing protein n=1 Tax=Loxodonta africana TaxID=9785 RepID=G3TNS9_LOXAF
LDLRSRLWSVSKPVEMTSAGATLVLRPNMTMNPPASMSPFTALPFLQPTLGPPHRTPWEQHQLPLMTLSCPSGTPLGLSAFPGTLLVPGVGESAPSGAQPGKIIVQVRIEGRQEKLPGTQTFVMAQSPLNWQPLGAPGGAVERAPPPIGEASAVEQMTPVTSVVGTLAYRGAPPPAAQLASVFPQVKVWSGQHGSSGEDSLATTQSRPSLDDSFCKPKSVYKNYRCWQRFKSLARRHHPQSPDIEALSCFLIPVLRSLAQLKPTMTLEEVLWRSVQEWEHKSNFDQMIFYEMAGKFMESETEEELQIQKLQQSLKRGSQFLVASGVPIPPGTILESPKYCPSNICLSGRGDTKAQPLNQQQHTPWCPWEAKQPNEISPKAVKEYVETMEGLLVPAHSATVEPGAKYEEKEENEQQQEDTGMYPDPGLLSYDKLCSQEEFITKVEAVIRPQILEILLSPESQIRPMSLTKKLEEEEGLTLTQLVEKRLLELKGEMGVEAPRTYGMPPMESLCSEYGTSQDSGSTDNHGLQLGISKKMGTKKL